MDLKKERRKRALQDITSWKGIIVGIIVLSMFVTMYQYKKQQRLAPYQKKSEISELDTKKKEPYKMDSMVYTNDKLNFYLEVPKDWKQIVKDGYDTFAEPNTGVFVQIQVKKYYPEINNESSNTLSGTLADEGYTIKNFVKKSNTRYEVLYQSSDDEVYDFVDEVFWDSKNVVTIHMGFNDKDYANVKDMIDYIVNSFVWDSENKIPKGYHMIYFPPENFECLLPDGWETTKVDIDYLAKDPETGAMISIRPVPECYNYLNDVTANDASKLISEGKPDFTVKKFKNNQNSIYLKATYIAGKVQRTNELYALADGYYHYLLLLDYEEGSIDKKMFNTLSKSLKSYNKKEDIEKKKNEKKKNKEIQKGHKKQKSKNHVGKTV